MAVSLVRPITSRRVCTVLVAAVVGSLSASSLSPAAARDDDRPAVSFRSAISAKKHGKKGTRLTRLVVRGLPAEAALNITCFPAGKGCPVSGTLVSKLSTAADGTQNAKIATRGLGDFPVQAMISLSGTAPGMAPHVVQFKVTRPGRFTELPPQR